MWILLIQILKLWHSLTNWNTSGTQFITKFNMFRSLCVLYFWRFLDWLMDGGAFCAPSRRKRYSHEYSLTVQALRRRFLIPKKFFFRNLLTQDPKNIVLFFIFWKMSRDTTTIKCIIFLSLFFYTFIIIHWQQYAYYA